MPSSIKIQTSLQTPVYKQIIEQIEAGIKNGDFLEGDLLPSMNELSAELEISKETIKKAYSILRERGIITATQGKGFYVADVESHKKLNILLLFDKLSTYKQVLYSSFESHIGANAEITIHLHNQNIGFFEYLVEENLDIYDYYVVTPHFSIDAETRKRLVKTLSRIPNRKLILLDRNIEEMQGNIVVVYQDFENDA